MNIVELPTMDLVPYENNPRNNEEAVDGVAESIDKFGFKVPIVITDENIIVAGHTRWLAAQKLGLASVPCIVADDLSEKQIKAFRLADNKVSELSSWDFAKLEEELAALAEMPDEDGFPPIDMEDFGFDPEGGFEGEDSGTESEDGDTDPEAAERAQGHLKEKFLFVPSSVLDARCGDWQNRKRLWLDLGLKSDGSRADMQVTGSLSGSVPGYYSYKEKKEKELGRKLSHKEFEEYLPEFLPEKSTIAQTNSGGLLSIFDPVLCELMYSWFSFEGAKVLDPFAGGSVRGVVASMLDRHYTGVDLRKEQIEENERQREELLSGRAIQPCWVCGDSTGIKDLAPGAYDFIFSCPPYFDLEKYSEDEKDLSNMEFNEFLAAYRKIIGDCVSMLAEDRFACFVVGDIRNTKNGGFLRNFVSETIRAFEDAGAALYNEIILFTCAGSLPIRVGRQFQASRKVGKQHQNVLVFYKGDPQKIRDIYGDVKISEEFNEKDENFLE